MRSKSGLRKLKLVTVILAACFLCAHSGKNDFKYRLFYDQGSISRFPDKFAENVKRAASFGYNGVICVDHAVQDLEKQSQSVLNSYKRALAVAKTNNIKLIPWHFTPTNPALEDNNLAEAFPVKNTKFMVSGGKAHAQGDHSIGLKNGGFESFSGNKPSDWSFTFSTYAIDKAEKKSGAASLRVTNAPAFSRIKQKVKVKPFRAYQISGWFKTAGISNYLGVQFSANGKAPLLHRRDRPFGTPTRWSYLSPTMDWSECVIDFNSLGNTHADIDLWFIYKGMQKGTIWVDDIKIREVGLYEVIRGKSKPVTVKSADGSKIYKEGKDYALDPKSSTFSNQSYNHEGHLIIPQGSSIKNGQEIRVDWYQYANVETMVPPSDFCLPEVWSALQDNLNRIDKIYGHSDAFFCNIDEWRVAGWNERCESFKFSTGGDYMARTWEGINCMLRKTNNGCRTVITWNDMFDPYHNSWHEHFACKDGSWRSWEGLTGNEIIWNWNGKYREQSLKFFSGLDTLAPNLKCRQLVCVFDAGMVNYWLNALAKTEKQGVEGVVGTVYTDWYNPAYPFMGQCANAFKARGKWPGNPFPVEKCAPLKNDECRTRIVTHSAGKAHRKNHASFWVANAGGKGIVHVRYAVSTPGQVALELFDMHGRRVETLMNEKRGTGLHRLSWNASALPAGVYCLQMSVDNIGRQTLKQVVF